MKKIIFMMIIIVICSFECVYTATNPAKRTDTYAYLSNGEKYNYTIYDIEGSKLFQAEDLAVILNGTSAGFDIAFYNDTYIISKNKNFTGISAKSPATDSVVPAYGIKNVSFVSDGVSDIIESYNIDGCKYFMLKDISKPLGIAIEWNKDNFCYKITDLDDNSDITELSMMSSKQLDEIEKRKKRQFYVDPNKPMLALTFDDGPKIGNTERIVAALEKTNSRATFFVVGQMVEKHPELVKLAYDAGCQIGNHTYSHENLVKLSSDEVKTQVNNVSNRVYEITGEYTMVGRPPYGSINDNVRNNFSIPWYNWNIDTLDWKHKDAEYVKKYVLDHAKDGSVILMHDLHKTTADAMESAIPELVKRGYQLVTMDELVKYKYNGDVTKVPGYVK